MSKLAELFAREIFSGNKVLEDVPKGLQEAVKELIPEPEQPDPVENSDD